MVNKVKQLQNKNCVLVKANTVTHARKVRTWKHLASLSMSVLCVSHGLELQHNPACLLSKLHPCQGEHSEEETSSFGHMAWPSTSIGQIFPSNQILQNNLLGLLLLSPKLTGALQSWGLTPRLGVPTAPLGQHMVHLPRSSASQAGAMLWTSDVSLGQDNSIS